MLVKNRWRVGQGFSPALLLLAACGGGGGSGGCPTSKGKAAPAMIEEVMASPPPTPALVARIPENQSFIAEFTLSTNPAIVSPSKFTITAVTLVSETTATIHIAEGNLRSNVTVTLVGEDAQHFRFVKNTPFDLSIQFRTAPNYEAPSDLDGKNSYETTLNRVLQSGITEAIKVDVTVTNLDDGATNVPSPSNRPSVPAHSRENDVIRIEMREGTTEVFLFNSDRLSSFFGNLFAGADADKFTVKRILAGGEQRTLLEFRQAQDASAPTDEGRDNIYNFELADAPASILGDLSFEVTVVDVA